MFRYPVENKFPTLPDRLLEAGGHVSEYQSCHKFSYQSCYMCFMLSVFIELGDTNTGNMVIILPNKSFLSEILQDDHPLGLMCHFYIASSTFESIQSD